MSRLIGAIYDCALDPGLWQTTLADVHEAMNFCNASLDLLEIPSGRVLLNVSSNLDPRVLAALPANAPDAIAQWGGPDRIQTYPVEEPLLLSVVNPSGLTCESRYYADYGEAAGWIDAMTIGLVRDRSTVGALTCGRHRDAGPVANEDLDLARLLIPHLKRAVIISRLLEVRSVTAATFEAVLDAIGASVLLVTADMRLVHANRAAEAMLTAGEPLQLRSGHVTGNSAVRAALAVAVAHSTEGSGMTRQGLGIPARGHDGSEHVLHVLPLAPGTAREVMPMAEVAIFVATATAPRRAPIDAIAALFDLTAAEARVLERIAAGESVSATAASLGIGVSTTRTHLVRLFDKTRTRRQGQLISMVAAFSLPFGTTSAR